MLRFLSRPDNFFLCVALCVGIILCLLIPPLGGGNETYNFQRTASIAYGHWRVEPANVPAGIADFLIAGDMFFTEGLTVPYGYSQKDYDAVSSISLQPQKMAILEPNAIAIHHPMPYVPQALSVRLAGELGMSPLTLFYVARMSGMLCAVALTFFAIRMMPSHRYLLAAIALLPPITFSRSTIDADQLTNAIALLLVAMLLREITGKGFLSGKKIGWLSLVAFAMAQCKTIYFLLSFLFIAIPSFRFFTQKRRIAVLFMAIVPGLIGSVAWLVLLKHGYMKGQVYTTWAGQVNPDAQIAFILREPLEYAKIFVSSVFSLQFIMDWMLGMLGVFGPPVHIPSWGFVLLPLLLCAVAAGDNTIREVCYPRCLKWIIGMVCVAFFILMPTILYIQWTGLQGPAILGFQGRYFYPLLPLLLVLIRPLDEPLRIRPLWLLVIFALCSVQLLLGTTAYSYYG